jgi:hypothetical protein
MATRANLPQLSLPDLRQTAQQAAAWRPELASDRKVLAWQLATAPWWIWSDVPKLPFPARNPQLSPGGLAGDWVVDGIDRIVTRVWIQRALAIVVRGVWLTVLLGCLWLVAELLGGVALNLDVLLGVGIVLLICSLVIAGLSRPTREQVARMLDRSFVLQERVSTAIGNIGIDIPAEGAHPQVTYLQVADAANAITAAQEHSAFRLRPPVRELVMAVALGLAFAALAFARGAGGGIPPTQSNVVPAFIPAAEQFMQPEQPAQAPEAQDVPTVEEVQQMVQTSIDNQQDLERLADALSDHAMTREAADLINQGNYAEAAEELRDVANQADQLSDEARAELASDLSQAAAEMSDGNKTLSESTEQAAEGLQEGGEQAQEGVRDLANAVEQSGQQVQSTEALDQAMQQAQEQAASNPSEQGQGSDAGNIGQKSPNDQSGNGSEQAPSSASGQQQGQPGEADSDSGANAEAGIGEDSQSSTGESGEGAPADANSPGNSEGQQGDSEGQPQPGGGSGSSTEDPAQAQSNQEGDPSQGNGAGGETGEGDPAAADTDGGGEFEHQTDGQKDPSESNVSDGTGEGADTSGATQDPQQAVELPRAPKGESVQIGGNSGTSSLGTGAGVTVSSGSSTQGEVGEPSPDSNHVPPEYRSIVESYFSEKDDG